MGNEFSRHHPGFRRRSQREKLLLLVTAGLAFSLMVIGLIVVGSKSSSSAPSTTTTTSQAAAGVPPAVNMVTLYTVEREVEAGSRMADVKIKELYWPRNRVPDDAVRDVAEIQGMFAKTKLSQGMPLQRGAFSKDMVRLSLPLTPGFRAVSIEVDETSSLEGHALPGTRVDVSLTYMVEKKLTTKVIVQNARVLSFGGDVTTLNERQGSGSVDRRVPTAGRTITLEVAPTDALQIQTARQLGRLGLMMRTTEDTETLATDEFDSDKIGGPNKHGKDSKGCRKGQVKISGQEYIIDCDGNMSEVLRGKEP